MTSRLLAALVAVTVLAVAAFSVPAAVAIHRAQERGDLLRLQREASIVASQIPGSGPIDETALDLVLASEHRLALYGPDGRRVGGIGPDSADAIVRSAMSGSFAEGVDGDDLVAAVPIRMGEDGSGLVIRVEEPRDTGLARYLRSLVFLAAAGAVVVTVAGLVGIWLARRLNRPIEELRTWAGAGPGAEAGPPAPTGIAELDGLRAALVDRGARIDELLARERSFSSHVSHQLRTPVAAMRVAIEAELEAPRPDPRTALGEALGEIDRLESTISSLLALARRQDRTATPCDLLELVQARAERWRRPLEEVGRALVVSGDPALGPVDADAVGHVVDVLLDNALHHGAGTVVVRVGLDGDRLVVTVADDGAAPSARDVFADAGTDRHHGIGLRLARSLAESSRGHLELRDLPTTTFRLTLPAGPAGTQRSPDADRELTLS